MATLKLAEAARAAHAERLRRLGAHALEVRQVTRRGRKTFVVVALFEERPPASLPSTLETVSEGRHRNVELVAKTAPPFQPD